MVGGCRGLLFRSARLGGLIRRKVLVVLLLLGVGTFRILRQRPNSP